MKNNNLDQELFKQNFYHKTLNIDKFLAIQSQ